jgi:hypothetical protein
VPSYYEGLPIYKAAADLVVRLDRAVRGFSRYHKYTLGARMREAAIDVVLLVARCNERAERARFLPELCSKIEELKLLANLGKEVQAFQSFKQFAQIVEQVVALARQAEGWRKSLPQMTGPEPARPAPARDRP